jgi:predicted dehydrogenase
MVSTRKVRVGLIGAGWWATANHLPVLAARDDVELTAVCRLGHAELRQVQEKFGFRLATEKAEELVNFPGLDAVVVTSPHLLHHTHARLALERGLHVMCEKPFCTRADQARELVELARAKSVHLLVPYGWHYKPFVQQAKRWLDGGAIGQLQYALCHMASPIRNLLQGKVFDVARTTGQASGPMFMPDLRTWSDPAMAGGGYGHAQLSHSTGMLTFLTGLEPQAVFALMTAPDSAVDLYDALSVRFKGGAIATISGAGTVPPQRTIPYQLDLRLFGSEGLLLLDCERARLELSRHDGTQEKIELAENDGAYTCDGPPHNFIDLIVGKTEMNWAPGESAMHSVALLDAAYRSAASGRMETV